MNHNAQNQNCRKNRKVGKDKKKKGNYRENADIEFSRKKGQLQALLIHGTLRCKDCMQDGTRYRWLFRKSRKFLSEPSHLPFYNAIQDRKLKQADT